MRKQDFSIGYGNRNYAVSYFAMPCKRYIGGRYVQITVKGNDLQNTLYKIAITGRKVCTIVEID